MSQRESQRAIGPLEKARSLKTDRPKKCRRIPGNLDTQGDVNVLGPINVQALQFQFPWMVETVENRIRGMGEAVREESAAPNRELEMDGFLQVLLRKYQKLQERIQTIQDGASRVEILETLEVEKFRRDLKMVLSELRKLVRETGSRKVMYTYRLLRRECQSSLTKLGQILSLNTGELDTPRGLHSSYKAAGTPVARAHANDTRNEVDVKSPISTLQSPRYAKKLAKRERHLPEIVIPSKPDGESERAERPRKSRRADDTPRLLKEARRFADSPAVSPRSTTTEKLLRRARQTAVVDDVEDASVLSRKIRDGDRRRKTQRPSGTGRHKEKPEDSPLSMSTEHMVRQLRRTAVKDDAAEAFEARSAESPIRRVSPEGSAAEGSVLGSQASAATGSQTSQASDATSATDATGSQNSSQGTALSSVGSTFASSDRTSEITKSSLWDSSMTASSGISSSAQSGTPSSVIESSKPLSAPMSDTE